MDINTPLIQGSINKTKSAPNPSKNYDIELDLYPDEAQLVDAGYIRGYIYHLCNSHALLQCIFGSKHHPMSRLQRILMFVVLLGFSFCLIATITSDALNLCAGTCTNTTGTTPVSCSQCFKRKQDVWNRCSYCLSANNYQGACYDPGHWWLYFECNATGFMPPNADGDNFDPCDTSIVFGSMCDTHFLSQSNPISRKWEGTTPKEQCVLYEKYGMKDVNYLAGLGILAISFLVGAVFRLPRSSYGYKCARKLSNKYDGVEEDGVVKWLNRLSHMFAAIFVLAGTGLVIWGVLTLAWTDTEDATGTVLGVVKNFLIAKCFSWAYNVGTAIPLFLWARYRVIRKRKQRIAEDAGSL